MRGTFRETYASVRNGLSKWGKGGRAFLIRFVSNWLFISEPDPLGSNYDHFRRPDGIPIHTAGIWCTVKGGQFFALWCYRRVILGLHCLRGGTVWALWTLVTGGERPAFSDCCAVCQTAQPQQDDVTSIDRYMDIILPNTIHLYFPTNARQFNMYVFSDSIIFPDIFPCNLHLHRGGGGV
jgi:hypothetical protein